MIKTPFKGKLEVTPDAESHGCCLCLSDGDEVIARSPEVERYGHPEQDQDEKAFAYLAEAAERYPLLADIVSRVSRRWDKEDDRDAPGLGRKLREMAALLRATGEPHEGEDTVVAVQPKADMPPLPKAGNDVLAEALALIAQRSPVGELDQDALYTVSLRGSEIAMLRGVLTQHGGIAAKGPRR